MFSSRTNLGLRMLYELAKEKNTGLGMTVADLKRNIGIDINMREPSCVLRDMKNASLVKSSLKSNPRKYYYAPNTEKASLYDLIMAVDNRFTLWNGYLQSFSGNPAWDLSRVIATETRIDHEITRILKAIPLIELICVAPEENEIITHNAITTTTDKLSPP